MDNSVFLKFALLVLTFCQSEALYPQYFQFYETQECFGPNLAFSFENVQNLSSLADVSKVASVKWRGLWALDAPGSLFMSGVDGGSLCWSWDAGAYDLRSAKLSKMIPTNLEEHGIVFMQVKLDPRDFEPIVVLEAEKSFEAALNFEAVAFTGLERYTIFEGTNFTGAASCLDIHPLVIEAGFGVNYHVRNVTVGSVRLGCNDASKRVKTLAAANPDVKQSSESLTSSKFVVSNDVSVL